MGSSPKKPKNHLSPPLNNLGIFKLLLKTHTNTHKNMKTLNFATFNVNGITKIYNNDGSRTPSIIGLDLSNITTDCKYHDLVAIAVQETHLYKLENLQKK